MSRELEAPALRAGAPTGGAGCSRRGCEGTDGEECAFVDRRGRRCEALLCSAHRDVVGGVTYCPRHASVVRTVVEGDAPLPDLANRAPCLASWIARDLDGDLADVLHGLVAGHEDLHLVTDPVRMTYTGLERTRTWTRSWKFVAHVGVAFRIDVGVEEAHDTEVIVRVNGAEMAREVPPWIACRQRGEVLDPDRDRALRLAFRTYLLGAVRTGLEQATPLV